MLLTRWQPNGNLWGELEQWHDRMNRLFGADRSHRGWPGLAVAYPTLNLWEDGKAVHAEAELPGLELDDLEIYVTGGDQLTIKGARKQPAFEQAVWHRQERGFGTFTRTVTLPAAVDADRVEARLCNGVVTLRLPKAEAARPRKITVKAE